MRIAAPSSSRKILIAQGDAMNFRIYSQPEISKNGASQSLKLKNALPRSALIRAITSDSLYLPWQ